jgi:hypothetical protein
MSIDPRIGHPLLVGIQSVLPANSQVGERTVIVEVHPPVEPFPTIGSAYRATLREVEPTEKTETFTEAQTQSEGSFETEAGSSRRRGTDHE